MLTTQHTSAGVYFVENDRGAQTQLVAGGVATRGGRCLAVALARTCALLLPSSMTSSAPQ